MPTCYICNKPSFVLRAHRQCKKDIENGLQKVSEAVEKFISSNNVFEKIESAINSIKATYNIDKKQLDKAVLNGLNHSITSCLDDGVFSKEEESRFNQITEKFGIENDAVQSLSNSNFLVKGLVLRDLFEGVIKSRVKLEGCSILFEKDETVLWCFTESSLYERKNKIAYQGGSSGVSIRVAKGLYYRTSAFKGQRVETVVTDKTDGGSLIVTNKNLYFMGEIKTHKFSIKKLISVQPFEDGIGFQENGARAKPKFIKNIDGWFAYNLVTNLKDL